MENKNKVLASLNDIEKVQYLSSNDYKHISEKDIIIEFPCITHKRARYRILQIIEYTLFEMALNNVCNRIVPVTSVLMNGDNLLFILLEKLEPSFTSTCASNIYSIKYLVKLYENDYHFTPDTVSYAFRYLTHTEPVDKNIISRDKDGDIAIFAGSFDPFTIGHASIVKQASLIFKKVIILIADNKNKKRRCNKINMLRMIRSMYAGHHVGVHLLSECDKTVLEYSQKLGVTFLIRDIMDLAYEKDIADYNKIASGNTLHTIFFRADNDCISSSLVWELYKNSNDEYKEYLPINIILNNEVEEK